MIRRKTVFTFSVFLLAMVFTGGHLFASGIQRNSAILILSSDISGKIFIHDWNNELAVELIKPFGKKIKLALEEGEYRITNIIGGDVYELEIVLVEGDSFEISEEELMKMGWRDIKQVEYASAQSKRDALLGDRVETHFQGGISMKSTKICGEYAVLLGGNIGLSFNRNLYVGLAAYARGIAEQNDSELDFDFDPGKPAYAGVIFAYSFAPSRPIHLQVGVLLGHGNYWHRNFYIFEPEIRVMLNLSQVARIGFGLSFPMTDRDKVGLDNPIFGMTFQFGR